MQIIRPWSAKINDKDLDEMGYILLSDNMRLKEKPIIEPTDVTRFLRDVTPFVGSSGAYNIMRTGISGADAATSTLDMAGSDNLQSTFDDATHIGGDLNEIDSRRRASRGKFTGPNTGIAIGLGLARNFNSLYELLRDEKAGNPTVTWYSKK